MNRKSILAVGVTLSVFVLGGVFVYLQLRLPQGVTEEVQINAEIPEGKREIASAEIINVGAITFFLESENSRDFLKLPPVQRDGKKLWYWTSDLNRDLEQRFTKPFRFDRFTYVALSPNKEWAMFAASKNRFEGLAEGEFKNVLGSINLIDGSVVVNELEEFGADVSSIIWMEENASFVVVTDSELAFCSIPRELTVNTCHFKVTANDIVQALRSDRGSNFAPHFRDIHWEDGQKERLIFSTNANTWTTKVSGKADWRIFRSGRDLSLVARQDQIETEIAEKLGVEFGCDERVDASECFSLIQWMFNIPAVQQGIQVVSIRNAPATDSQLAQFFRDNFPGLKEIETSSLEYGAEDATITQRGQTKPVSSGKPQLWRIVSFRTTFLGEDKTHVMLLRDLQEHESLRLQGGSGRNLSGVMRTLGPSRIFVNSPEFLVSGHAPFFVVNETPPNTSCSPFRWKKILYYLDDNSINLNLVWSSEYYRDGKFAGNSEVESTIIGIQFEDLNDDGNEEIIQEGKTSFCTGDQAICYSRDCSQFTNSFEMRRIFQWNSSTKTFEEQG